MHQLIFREVVISKIGKLCAGSKYLKQQKNPPKTIPGNHNPRPSPLSLDLADLWLKELLLERQGHLVVINSQAL